MSAIRRFARQVADRFHPEKIILFGSYAYGQPHVDSDVDSLVVMRPTTKSIRLFGFGRRQNIRFALDLIVRTPRELEVAPRGGDCSLREVVGRGKRIVLSSAESEQLIDSS